MSLRLVLFYLQSTSETILEDMFSHILVFLGLGYFKTEMVDGKNTTLDQTDWTV